MMANPIDTIQPWTIKAIPNTTREIITAAARRENMTVGQWIERRVNEWEGQGSPEPRGAALPVDLIALMNAAAALSANPKLPREVRALINERARQERVILGQKHGHTDHGQSTELSPISVDNRQTGD